MRADRDNRKIAIAEMANEYLSTTDAREGWKKAQCPVCKGFGCNLCREMGVVFFSGDFGRVKVLDNAFIEMLLNRRR